MSEETNLKPQLTEEEIKDITRVKLFSILEYLEQQIEFIATNYSDTFIAYQNSKQFQTKIAEHEKSIEQRQN